MGGDFGPPNIVGGAVMALKEYPHIEKLFLVGDTPRIEKELKQHHCNDRPHRNRPCDPGGRDERWRRRFRPAEKGFVRQPRGGSGKKGGRDRDCERRTHRRGGGGDDDQVADASGRRSARHRRRHPLGNQHLCFDRCRREQRPARGAHAAIRASWARSIPGTSSVTRTRRSA